MNEQLSLLISLQDIDSTILSIAEEIEILPNKLDKAKAPLKEIHTSFESNKSEHEKLDKKKKEKYSDLEDTQQKINNLKAKGKEIKTNKEYEAHLKEIKNFEERKDQLEEEILFIMETLDTLLKDFKKVEEKLKKAEENYKKEEKILEDEKNKLYSEMEIHKIKRKDIVRKVEEEIYEEYMILIKTGGGRAVVQTRNEICFGCNTNIPPQLYNDIKADKGIYNCYYCNRFLFCSPQSMSPDVDKQSD
ncbi:MAG: hypothetical protein KAI96_04855 [Thermodesulfovibrionia bacterium]|nr:hypothetical protein [Thermodesulfovibrionia bacterium]